MVKNSSGKGVMISHDEYMDKVINKYGNSYNYDKLKYISTKRNIIVGCKIHGDFEIRADRFLSNNGCKQCTGFFKKDTEYFIKKSKDVHGDRYDYTKSNYINSATKLTITCKIHGDFEQRPSHHYKGNNCPECGKLSTIKTQSKTNEDYLAECIAIHGNRYDYSKTLYTTCRNKVIITCKIHGDFSQRPKHHSTGSNCPKCIDIGYTRSDFIKASTNKGRDGTGDLYILEFKNDVEHFYKIGISVDFQHRLNVHKSNSYDCNVIATIKGDAKDVYDNEKYFLKELYNSKYLPLGEFTSGGINECFLHDDIETLVESVKKRIDK